MARKKKASMKSERQRLCDILEELDPLSEEYLRVLQRLDKLEEANARGSLNRLSVSNILGNATTIGTSLLAYWHEDVLGRIPTRGLGRSVIPKSQTKR